MTALATSSYKAFRQSMGVPVQTSVGRPRFPIDYELREEVRDLMPLGLLNLKGDAFREAYIAQLDRLDLDALRAQFTAIQKRHDGKRVVLLCFEDVKAGEHCHRRDFADWWQARTGQRVPEVGHGNVILERHPDYDHRPTQVSAPTPSLARR